MRTRWSVLVAVAGVVVVVASVVGAPGATPNGVAGYGVSIQAVFDSAGNPLLVANFSPDGSLATPSFSICPPSGGCETVGAGPHGLRPGPEPSGTRFIATASYRGQAYAASVTWHGRPHATDVPGLVGRPRHGSVLRPIAAHWQGGWGGEFDQLGVEACRTPRGQHCRMLGGGELGCPDASSLPRLGTWFAGWYLFALDARLPRGDACAGTGYASNASLPLWPLGPTIVRSGALGRIIAKRPTIRFLSRAILTAGRLYVARVRCPSTCQVTYVVWDTDQGSQGQARFTGTRLLGVKPRGLRQGPLAVRMFIDDSPMIVGKTRF